MQGGDVGFERLEFLKDVEGPAINDFSSTVSLTPLLARSKMRTPRRSSTA
ncbi:MAG: hypothetical protein ACLRWP_20815 [Bilophila wadsworthia]